MRAESKTATPQIVLRDIEEINYEIHIEGSLWLHRNWDEETAEVLFLRVPAYDPAHTKAGYICIGEHKIHQLVSFSPYQATLNAMQTQQNLMYAEHAVEEQMMQHKISEFLALPDKSSE